MLDRPTDDPGCLAKKDTKPLHPLHRLVASWPWYRGSKPCDVDRRHDNSRRTADERIPAEMTSSAPLGLGPDRRFLLPLLLAAVAAILLWQLIDVALVVFAAVLVAIALCGLAEPISKLIGIPRTVGVLLITSSLVGLVAVPLASYGNRLWAQFDEIALDIPTAVESIKRTIESHPSGRLLEELLGGADFTKAVTPVAQHIGALAATFGTITSYLIFIVFGGLYLAIDPGAYIDGLVRFAPAGERERLRRFLGSSGKALRTWLFTQLLVVLMNGIFSTVGLFALGVHSAVALGILAGILSFIPYVGTIAAMVIGALAALTQGAQYAIYALVVLGAVSFFEGYFVTPYIQSRTLSIPPVVLLFSLFAFTVLFGTLGIILAAPLTIVVIMAIDTFYPPAPATTTDKTLLSG
jgi:predicted PurR-regulated permease PerM